MFSKKVVIAVSAALAALGAGCAKQEVSFKQHVHPVLKESCLSCHGAGGEGYIASGFSVESYDSVMKGTKFGRVIVPGSSLSSTLVILIEHRADPTISMPRKPTEPMKAHEKIMKDWKTPILPAEKIKLIRDWIDQGAKNN